MKKFPFIKLLFYPLLLCTCSASVDEPHIKGSIVTAHPLITMAGLNSREKGDNLKKIKKNHYDKKRWKD